MPATSVSATMALGGGLVFFFNPCVWPLYPAYVSYIAGSSLDDLGSRYRRKILLNTLGFMLGFSMIFMTLGSIASSLGSFYENQAFFERIAGIVIIFFGLQLSGLFNLSFMSKEKKLSFLPQKPGFFSSVIFGATFALGWTPCATPILGAILAYAFTHESLLQGAFVLGLFSLGFGVPFFIFSLLFSFINNIEGKIANISRYLPVINRVSGFILLAVGGLLLFNQMSNISVWLFEIIN